MSLVYTTLKADLLDAFNSMDDGDDDYFAEQVAIAVKTYIETGDIATVDTGTVSAGVFTGAGSGDMEVESDDCKNILLPACTTMRSMTGGGDNYLAEKLASAIDTMVLAGTVETDVSGTAVAGSVSTPLSGKAEGTLTGIAATIQSALINIFNSMQDIRDGSGDEYFADEMATVVNTYLLAGIVSTNGKNALSGSVGAGKMT